MAYHSHRQWTMTDLQGCIVEKKIIIKVSKELMLSTIYLYLLLINNSLCSMINGDEGGMFFWMLQVEQVRLLFIAS